MSSFMIKHGDLMNLTSRCVEVRLLTLKVIFATFQRAIVENKTVDVDNVVLLKQLIRWFGFNPIEIPLHVLAIIKCILDASESGPKIMTTIGIHRLLKELDKIRYTIKGHPDELKCCEKIRSIRNILNEALREAIIKENKLSPKTEFHKVSGKLNEENEENSEKSSEDEMALRQPLAMDYDAMQIPAEILVNPLADAEQIENVLRHLQVTLCDYPVDFLLQSPHIFRNLVFHYDERDSSGFQHKLTRQAASTLLTIVHEFFKSLSIDRKSIAHFIPTILSSKSSQSKTKRQAIVGSSRGCKIAIESALRQLMKISCAYLELHINDGYLIPEVWEIIYSTLHLYVTFDLNITAAFDLKQILSMIDKLQANFGISECCTRLRLCQMQLLLILKDILQLYEHQNQAMDPEICLPLLKDYTIKCILPKKYQEYRSLILRTQKSLQNDLLVLDRYEKAFQYATEMLLKAPDKEFTIDIDCISKYREICLIMDKIQSKTLFDRMFQHIVACNYMYCTNAEILVLVKELLQELMLLSWPALKKHIYSKLELTIKQFIGCLMSGERFSTLCLNTTLLEAQIVGVPISTKFLEQLLYESNAEPEKSDGNTNIEIQTHCYGILAILLKSNNLFAKYWTNFLQLFAPIMPLLSCCTKSKEIMEVLIKMYNPDYKALSSLCILKGNISFLFHRNSVIRSEALNRLVYILNTDKDAHKLLPNILHVKDKLSDELCYAVSPREFKDIFSYDRDHLSEDIKCALKNLCYLLDAADIEPLTRKSTLMQINVLCTHWLATAELCKMGSDFLILHALQNALHRASTKEYPDSVEPAIGCLAKILLCDTNTRCQLAEKSNIYVLVLRAMMLLRNNKQVRQDATLCLFLLLFSKQIQVTVNAMETMDVLQNIQCPLKLEFISTALKKASASEDEKSLAVIFTDEKEEHNYWRLVIAGHFSGGLENITLKTIKDLTNLGELNNELQLSRLDIRWIRFSQPDLCTQKILHAISNATEHRTLIQAATLIKTHLLLHQYSGIDNFSESAENYLWNVLSRFIQLRPGNAEDIELFEHTLDVIIFCVRGDLRTLMRTLMDSLNKDNLHALVTMLLQKEEIPLHIFYKITTLLRELFQKDQTLLDSKTDYKCLISKLFENLLKSALIRFRERDLHRVRCLLQIMVSLSARNDLSITDENLLLHCNVLYYISMGLKCYTQTGAQIHRDCLQCILQLGGQMNKPSKFFWVRNKVVCYTSALCSHADPEVKILAWSLLHLISEGSAPPPITQKNVQGEKVTEKESSESKLQEKVYQDGGHMLLIELNYLPGGFLACCLCTFLDDDEVICIRILAGLLFSSLVTHNHNNLEKSIELMDQNKFLDIGLSILKYSYNCTPSTKISTQSDTHSQSLTSCDLIGCFANICCKIGLHSLPFINKLCQHNFMLRLYEVMKHSLPESVDPIIYLRMVAEICRVYTLCSSNYSNNFGLLQRTICRDVVWLRGLCYVLFIQQDIDFVLKQEKGPAMIVDILTLLTVLLKDAMAFEQISQSICNMAREFSKFFGRILDTSEVGSRLQSQALATLTLLFLKSQPERLKEKTNMGILPILMLCDVEEDCAGDNPSNNKDEEDTLKVGQRLCIQLTRLLVHVYPLNVCKFQHSPSAVQQQIVECFALLLKVSSQAQYTAELLKLRNKITNIFQNFLDEFAAFTCTTYIRRYGEAKKNAVLKNLLLLLTFLMYWFSAPTTLISDDLWSETISKILIQFWPWLAYSPNLKLIIFQLCAFLSEKSFVIIKKFAILNSSSFQHSILQLIMKAVTSDTLKVKANVTEYTPTIVTGLRVLMNCCACVEGRNTLLKGHVLDIIDVMYPFNPKATRLRIDIVRAWLQFWELYTRYEEGGSATHLYALCEVIRRQESNSEIRLLCLQILRNMSFLDKNRSTLITSRDFFYVAFDVLAKPIDSSTPSYEEQLLMSTALWKIISSGIKTVSIIRGTKLAKQLCILQETLQTMLNEQETEDMGQYAQELLQVLNTLSKIFANS